MSLTVGVVCEGPTDYVVIQRIVDKVTQKENEYLLLQPDESLDGSYGNGWKGVWRWCEENAENLDSYMKKATPQIDCLIVQMDGDVSRKEKEVHCICDSTPCQESGKVHPLHCQICKDGQCPVALPCGSHEPAAHSAHLHSLVKTWLSIESVSSPVIITIPCDSTDTWVAVAYGDLTEECEAHIDPWDTIIARGASYHSIRIPGKKKRVRAYEELADHLYNHWDVVKARCSEALSFELAILENNQRINPEVHDG